MADFENESFDCVIDKGLLDSMLVDFLLDLVWFVFETEFEENVERDF